MFSSEIKETIYVAISLMLAAAILGMVAFVLDIRSDFATIQNQEITARTEMSAFSEYDKYQDNILYGEDVMALIRECAGSDIAVYIDTLVCKEGKINKIYLDREEYLKNPSKYSIYALEFGKDDGGNNVMKGGVSREATYYAYLVFGKYTDKEIKNAGFTEQGYTDSDGNPVYVNYSDVTGVVVKLLKPSNPDRYHYSEVETEIKNIRGY